MKRPRKPFKRGTVLTSPNGTTFKVLGCDWTLCPHCDGRGILWEVNLQGHYKKQISRLRDLDKYKITLSEKDKEES